MAIKRLTFLSSESTELRSAISSTSSLISCIRFNIYSLLIFLSFISATYSACFWSISKPEIRLGTTMASTSVLRIISIALSMSNSIFDRPCRRWSFALFLSISNFRRRFTQSIRKRIHSDNIPFIPSVFGLPSIRRLKLQLKESHKGVMLNNFAIIISASALFLISIAILRPFKSVSSRTSVISLILPLLTKDIILSIIDSIFVV